MGADLYIRAINQPLRARYQPLFDQAVRRRDSLPRGSKEAETVQQEVSEYYDRMYSEGYYSDSYNATCVLATLGLSWWGDVASLCTERMELAGPNLKRFREMVANATQHLPSKEELEANHVRMGVNGNSVEAWHQYFIGERMKLLAFMDQAIELNTSIECCL